VKNYTIHPNRRKSERKRRRAAQQLEKRLPTYRQSLSLSLSKLHAARRLLTASLHDLLIFSATWKRWNANAKIIGARMLRAFKSAKLALEVNMNPTKVETRRAIVVVVDSLQSYLDLLTKALMHGPTRSKSTEIQKAIELCQKWDQQLHMYSPPQKTAPPQDIPTAAAPAAAAPAAAAPAAASQGALALFTGAQPLSCRAARELEAGGNWDVGTSGYVSLDSLAPVASRNPAVALRAESLVAKHLSHQFSEAFDSTILVNLIFQGIWLALMPSIRAAILLLKHAEEASDFLEDDNVKLDRLPGIPSDFVVQSDFDTSDLAQIYQFLNSADGLNFMRLVLKGYCTELKGTLETGSQSGGVAGMTELMILIWWMPLTEPWVEVSITLHTTRLAHCSRPLTHSPAIAVCSALQIQTHLYKLNRAVVLAMLSSAPEIAREANFFASVVKMLHTMLAHSATMLNKFDVERAFSVFSRQYGNELKKLPFGTPLEKEQRTGRLLGKLFWRIVVAKAIVPSIAQNDEAIKLLINAAIGSKQSALGKAGLAQAGQSSEFTLSWQKKYTAELVSSGARRTHAESATRAHELCFGLLCVQKTKVEAVEAAAKAQPIVVDGTADVSAPKRTAHLLAEQKMTEMLKEGALEELEEEPISKKKTSSKKVADVPRHSVSADLLGVRALRGCWRPLLTDRFLPWFL
jgi:hypothetical protein